MRKLMAVVLASSSLALAGCQASGDASGSGASAGAAALPDRGVSNFSVAVRVKQSGSRDLKRPKLFWR